MKCYLMTLGCPKNSVDSESMATLAQLHGHTIVATHDEADVIIVNTCSFLQAARHEATVVLRELARTRQPHQRIIAAGCMAQHHPELLAALPGVDATLSTREWMNIGTLIAPSTPASSPIPVITDWRTGSLPRTAFHTSNVSNTYTPSAYVKIADGCNLHCSFCTIPHIKGAMRSKPIADVVREIEELAACNVREVILVAQHLTDYGSDMGLHDGLSTLLTAVCQSIPNTMWVRLMYAYPQYITPTLIETMARYPHICAYLDMPLQHAHPDTLRRMHRPTDVDATIALIGQLRDAMPHIALRSTFIVGFPGETLAEFRTLLEFISHIKFDWVGVFRYSREMDTPAASLPHPVNTAQCERRWHRIMERQQTISYERNAQWVGRTLDVLVEGHTTLDDGRALVVGRSFRQAPDIDGQVFVWGHANVGDVIRATITDATNYDMWGKP